MGLPPGMRDFTELFNALLTRLDVYVTSSPYVDRSMHPSGGNFMFTDSVLARDANEQSGKDGVPFAATLLELLTEANSRVEVDRKAAQAYLSRATGLLAASLEREAQPRAGPAYDGGMPRWQARRVQAFIEENLEQPFRSPDLIALTGMSAGHFFRTFKATFGQAPFAYIASLRIKRSQQLMLTTDHSLSQIALDCGMCDQSHFTRMFRRIVGVPPGEWRRIYACGTLTNTRHIPDSSVTTSHDTNLMNLP